MQPVMYNIRLEVTKPGNQASIEAKRGDVLSRRINVSLHNNSVPYVLEDSAVVVLRAIKPDGTVVFADCDISGGMAHYLMTPQILAVEGVVQCELTVYGPRNEVLFSPMFDVYVGGALYDDERITSTDEFSALGEALTQAKRYERVWGNPSAKATTGEPGTEADADIALHEDGAEFHFVVPQGERGLTGAKGEQGKQGDKGNVMYAVFAIDLATGILSMTTDAAYDGPDFQLSETGELEVLISA